MPVTEQPVVNLLTFQIWDAGIGAYRDLKAQATQISIKRGGSQSGASTSMNVGTLDATLFGANNLAGETALRPNSPIRVIRKNGKPEFTGTVSDLYQTVDFDKVSGVRNIYTTVQAVDAVQSLANTDRNGVVTGPGYQTWAARIGQLATSANVVMDVPANTDAVIVPNGKKVGVLSALTWTPGSGNTYAQSVSSGTSYYTVGFRKVSGTNTTTNINTRAMMPLKGLDSLASYSVTMTVQLTGNTGFSPGQYALAYSPTNTADLNQMVVGPIIDLTTGDAQTVSMPIQPTQSTGYVGVVTMINGALSGVTNAQYVLTVSGINLTRVGDPKGYLLQDVAYESSLINHLDLACDSVGARWWVNKAGRVVFRRQLDNVTPALTVSDTNSGDISYTDVSLSYDTRNVVNSIKINQHGRVPDSASQNAGNADDYSLSFTSDSSIRRWGTRGSEMDTCLYLGGTHTRDLNRRASEVMSFLDRPIYSIDRFTINVQSNPNVLDALELRAAIGVKYGNVDQTARVLSISHTITPTRWLVDVEVNEVRAGVTFQDLTDAFTGTFADFNAAYAGKTFAAFSANPLSGANNS